MIRGMVVDETMNMVSLVIFSWCGAKCTVC
jgi:RNase P/RNase MRP subunit p29